MSDRIFTVCFGGASIVGVSAALHTLGLWGFLGAVLVAVILWATKGGE